ARGGAQVEVAVHGVLDERRIARGGGERRAVVKLRVAVVVEAGRDVEGPARSSDDKRVDAYVPGQRERAAEGEAMAHVYACAPVLLREIVVVGGERACAVRVALGHAERVVGKDRELRIEPRVREDDQLVLV